MSTDENTNKTAEKRDEGLRYHNALIKENLALHEGLRRANERAELWQAKFHTLRLENNGLRRRLRKQAAPAPAPEPQWHNPDKLTPDQIGDGFRLLAKHETVLPSDADLWTDRWSESMCRGETFNSHGILTYRTRTPLPK
jgi:hypothetical protein